VGSSSGNPLASAGSSSGYPLARSLPRDTAPIAGAAPLAFDQLIPESIKNKLSTSTNGLDKGGQIIGSLVRYFPLV
jgi:hypothetical protein